MADKYNLGTVGGIAVTELWSGSAGNITGDGECRITLNDNITNYKFLIFDFYCTANGNIAKRYYSKFISVQQFTNFFNNADPANTTISFTWGYSGYTDYFDILRDGTTTNVLSIFYNYTQCLRIVGIN